MVNSRFDEAAILKDVHKGGLVPGVIQLLCSEATATSFFHGDRINRRFGFRQIGARFMRIDTVETMLEAAFDVLQVTRYLRIKHKVLHRDPQTRNAVRMNQTFVSSDIFGVKVMALWGCLSRIVSEPTSSSSPQETSALLIDFNRAERIRDDLKSELVDVAGTPIFIARAVECQGPYPDPKTPFLLKIPAMPKAPSLYEKAHPQRIVRFKGIEQITLDSSTATLSSTNWRHELYHDAESFFWLILY
ncbi:hypothetical protein HYPSUDRAFT_51074 [Hypholoma sublateritium FD-334 SS-4]|uniref:Fungal-type protein kinase domain-containing protein n=1 Tax=Hypholoma sublateritium (strain FD-334 SS-4) TaxID=945553 RepID=A0A0D2PKP8_HYPSF|nr:hypothetical protein HYPSUDRAFT_51074 [Hypholoma sublateritium FD-334 SS-4]